MNKNRKKKIAEWEETQKKTKKQKKKDNARIKELYNVFVCKMIEPIFNNKARNCGTELADNQRIESTRQFIGV